MPVNGRPRSNVAPPEQVGVSDALELVDLPQNAFGQIRPVQRRLRGSAEGLLVVLQLVLWDVGIYLLIPPIGRIGHKRTRRVSSITGTSCPYRTSILAR